MVANITTFMPSPYLHWFFSSTHLSHRQQSSITPVPEILGRIVTHFLPWICCDHRLVVTPNGWNPNMEVDGKWCSVATGWFLASMLIFQGVWWKKCHVNILQITKGIVTIWHYHIILRISTRYEQHWTCRSLRTFQNSADTMTSSKSNFNQLALCKNNLG